MNQSRLDPAPITRHLRAKAGSHLLVAAVHHLHVFELLSKGPCSLSELQQKLALKERPVMVLLPALCAMDVVGVNEHGMYQLSALGKFLNPADKDNLTGYTGLEKDDPGVLKMTQWLLKDGAEDVSKGLSYVKDEAAPSPMDEPASARFFTMALAGRARYLSPIVAGNITKLNGHLLDVAGGTGYYAYEWLLANPNSTATVFDRPEVLNIAQEILESFCSENPGVENRVTFLAGDMLTDPLPQTDLLLAASLFHDWPTAVCRMLAHKFAGALKRNGEIWIHDAFLNDSLDGPLAVTDYSAMLFLGTKGRAYSRKEYRSWLSAAGLLNSAVEIPTMMDYGLISAFKPAK